MKELKELLYKLCLMDAVSGREKEWEKGLLELASPIFDEAYSDKFGSLVFIKRSTRENTPKLLIDAHFDKIGMMVSSITENGFLGVTAVGGLDRRILPASEVKIHASRDLYGVIASIPPHISKKNDVPEISDIYIDTGLDKNTLKELVSIGDYVTLTGEFQELLNDRVTCAGLDDKACLTAILDMVSRADKSKLCFDIYVTASAQEETGKNGARLVAYSIKPDIAIATDVNFAFSEGLDTYNTIEMGKGACVDISATTDRRLTKSILRLCEQRGIPYSPICEPSRTGTNADGISVCGEGIKTALLGVPLRAMHTPSEVVSLRDISSLSKILEAVACTEKEELI